MKHIAAGMCCFILISLCAHSQTSERNQTNTGYVSVNKNDSSPLEGAWELVWENTGGKIRSAGNPTQIKLFTAGYFSYLMEDSAGKWSYAGAGTYEVNGNTYIEKHLYCTVPEYVGSTDWQEFEMQGDTLVFKLFNKVIDANGKDVTDQWPKIVEKRVRARK